MIAVISVTTVSIALAAAAGRLVPAGAYAFVAPRPPPTAGLGRTQQRQQQQLHLYYTNRVKSPVHPQHAAAAAIRHPAGSLNMMMSSAANPSPGACAEWQLSYLGPSATRGAQPGGSPTAHLQQSIVCSDSPVSFYLSSIYYCCLLLLCSVQKRDVPA